MAAERPVILGFLRSSDNAQWPRTIVHTEVKGPQTKLSNAITSVATAKVDFPPLGSRLLDGGAGLPRKFGSKTVLSARGTQPAWPSHQTGSRRERAPEVSWLRSSASV